MAFELERSLCPYELIREDIIKEKEEFFEKVFGHSPRVQKKQAKIKVAQKKKIKRPENLRRSPRSQLNKKRVADDEERLITDEDRRSPRSQSNDKQLADNEERLALDEEKSTPRAASSVVDMEVNSGFCSGSTNVGKFKCSDCEKVFSFSNSLVKHRKTKHSTIVHLCDICNKTFRYKDSVLRHKNAVHSEVKTEYICTICSHNFRYKCNLKAHHVKFHNNEL
eukprot:GFUD01010051.1.p1 GENE.GFUD01010051.1~~GFUD01010051.1.p1  ORF type:complete len:223 (-),score=46.75 GFUD01010051.1:52-720(-)